MTWILLAFLLYALVGAALASRTFRGMHVTARSHEWAVLILLWPLMLRLFLQLAFLQAQIHHLRRWGETRARRR